MSTVRDQKPKHSIRVSLAKDAQFIQEHLRRNFLTGPVDELTPDHVERIMRGYMVGVAGLDLDVDSEVRCDIEVTEALDVVNVFTLTVPTEKPEYVLEHFYRTLAAEAPSEVGYVPEIKADGNRLVFTYRTTRFADADLGADRMKEEILALAADHRRRLAYADAEMREAESDVLDRDRSVTDVIERQRKRFERASAARSLLGEMATQQGTIQITVPV